ncbi:MAG: hypothetical protein ACHQ03_08680 [Candidatus Bathyarchaeia archaeon]
MQASSEAQKILIEHFNLNTLEWAGFSIALTIGAFSVFSFGSLANWLVWLVLGVLAIGSVYCFFRSVFWGEMGYVIITQPVPELPSDAVSNYYKWCVNTVRVRHPRLVKYFERLPFMEKPDTKSH